MARLKYINGFIPKSDYNVKWAGHMSEDDPIFPIEQFENMPTYNPDEYLLVEYHVFEFEGVGKCIVRWRLKNTNFHDIISSLNP